MSQTRQRVMFAAMLLLGLLSPLIVLLPVLALPDSVIASLNGVPGVALVVFALFVPLIFLYLAARAAVRGGIPGVLVLGVWWLMNVLAAFANWGPEQPANAVIKALTFGVIAPSGDGAWPLPGPVLGLGASRGFSIDLPLYVLFLMGAYTGIKLHQAKIARAAEHKRLYSAWDETGERVDSSNIGAE